MLRNYKVRIVRQIAARLLAGCRYNRSAAEQTEDEDEHESSELKQKHRRQIFGQDSDSASVSVRNKRKIEEVARVS